MPAAPAVGRAHQIVVVVAAEHAQLRDSLDLGRVVEHGAHPRGVAVDVGLDVGDVMHAHRHPGARTPARSVSARNRCRRSSVVWRIIKN